MVCGLFLCHAKQKGTAGRPVGSMGHMVPGSVSLAATRVLSATLLEVGWVDLEFLA